MRPNTNKKVDATADNMGKWIKQFRALHGLTQRDFAKLSGLALRTVFKYENGGGKRPTYSACKQIAEVIGVSLGSLYAPLDSEGIERETRNIDSLSKRSHQIAVEKQWWVDYDDCPPRFKPYIVATKIALIASEINEALEAARDNLYQMYDNVGKPDGVVVELADAIIRIFDLCEKLGLDLKGALLAKLAFNEKRPIKHGKVF